MKKVSSEHARGFVTILAEILVGVLLLVKPIGFTRTIIIAAGVLLVLGGVRNVVHYFKTNARDALKEQSLTKGLLALMLGGFCIASPDWFLSTFPALSVIYGVVMLAMSIAKVQSTIDMYRMKHPRWYLYAISALVTAVCAVVIILNPFTVTRVLWQFAGISLIVEGVLDAVSMILGGVDEPKAASN